MPATMRASRSPLRARLSMALRGTLTMANSAATKSALSSTSARITRQARSLSTALLPRVGLARPLAPLLRARRGHHPAHRVVRHALHLGGHPPDLHPLAHRGHVPQLLGHPPAQGVALPLQVDADPRDCLVEAQPPGKAHAAVVQPLGAG